MTRPARSGAIADADMAARAAGGADDLRGAGDVAVYTRRSRSSFYYAFLLLPEEKRRAIFAVYALARAIDDAVDEAPDAGAARERLAQWREEVARLAAGRPEHAITRELQRARERFPIPIEEIEALLEGARMDLEIDRYARWDDLRIYCERVASSIGRICLAIFGHRSPTAVRYAVDLGIALQLTNILRDLATDARRGRLYVPLEDLERHGVSEGEIMGGSRTENVRALLAFEAARTRAFFRSAGQALAPVDRESLLAAEVMRHIYERLLARIERAGPLVFERRITVSRPRRAAIALSVLLRTKLARSPSPSSGP